MLRAIPDLEVPRQPAWARSNWQSYCVRLPDHCDQRRVMQYMLDRDIATRRGVMCSHLEPPYSGMPVPGSLARSEAAQKRCIILPLYPQMTEEEQQRVTSTLLQACRSA
jgi:dTDP-4-amino-4,6-dideoxygalactose transaminase